MGREKRSRLQIYVEILEAVKYKMLVGDLDIKITHIQNDVNVPYVRFKQYLSELEAKGLITSKPQLALTHKGEEFLSNYRRVAEFLSEFGLL